MDEEPQILLKEGMMKKHMPPPFPQALRGKKPIKNASEILDVLRQVKSKSLPSVGNSRKSYLQVTSQKLARGKLVHLHGWRSLALPSVGSAETTKLPILAFGPSPGYLSSKKQKA
ncbi:hypothetical protein AAG906_006851 [Vitis piasezkii]